MSPGGGQGAGMLDVLTGYQGAAIIGTAVELGVPAALAGGPRTVAGVAASLGLDSRACGYLLGALVVLGLATREGDRYALAGSGRELVDAEPGSAAEIVRKEWFFYRVWAELPQAIRDGHARIPPWRDRLRTDPAQSLTFLRALDDLAKRFGGGLPELAGLERGGHLLDAGGGAGSHSAYLESAVPGLEATVLDLPEAETVLRERHPGLRFVAGDLDEPRFGRPRGEQWDHVLLANILHDRPADRCREIVAEAAGLLAPGGTLLVYEWVLADDEVSPPAVALFALMMLVENEGGGTWTEQEIASWARDAGLEPEPVRRDAGTIAVIRARKAATP